MPWTTHLISFATSVLIGGFIGWITNLIAVKSLFHPRQPRRYGPMTFHGLLPKRQVELAENLGRIIEGELVSLPEVARTIRPQDLDPVIREAVKAYCRDVQEWIRPTVQTFRADFLLGPLTEELEKRLFRAIQPQIPGLLEKAASQLAAKISIREMVAEKIKIMDLERLEELTFRIADREMAMIIRVGGILGMVVGALQWLIFQGFFA
jgi:uncharacterized membrane protein YheB (UPF0754 family)